MSVQQSMMIGARLAGLGIVWAGLIAATAPTHAAVTCPQGLSGGTPKVDQQHIFCGEINGSGKAVGFHSRPGGANPATVTGTGAGAAKPGVPGVYNLSNFTITQGTKTATKGLSTMYPDTCSVAQVITAIQNAYNTSTKSGTEFNGSSGNGVNECKDTSGKAFPIKGFTATDGGLHIRTAYPN